MNPAPHLRWSDSWNNVLVLWQQHVLLGMSRWARLVSSKRLVMLMLNACQKRASVVIAVLVIPVSIGWVFMHLLSALL